MLVELAVGDAYGASFEYARPDFVAEHNTLLGYVQHPDHFGVRPGAYTDDTQMTLAVAELMVSGEPWTAERLAEKFVEVFKRDEILRASIAFTGDVDTVATIALAAASRSPEIANDLPDVLLRDLETAATAALTCPNWTPGC